MTRIIIADDEDVIRKLLADILLREGYEVATARDGQEVLDLVSRDPPDLIVLDIMMPRLDGFEVCRRVRLHSTVPILMLTALAAESDTVHGLEMGADDYQTKPFKARELLARINALLRRAGTGEMVPEQPVTIEDLVIDFRSRSVTVKDRQVHLTPLEFRLLSCLAAHAGVVLSCKRLVKLLYDYDCTEQEAIDMIRVSINRLRLRIEETPSNPHYIRTVRGFGYTLGTPTFVPSSA